MIIRKIEPSDNEILARIIKNTFDEHDAPKCGTVYSDPTTDDLYTLFEKENSVLWVAEDQNELLGCCGIYPTEGLPQGYVELVKFYLAPSARGKGVGTKLMEQNITSAKDLGYTAIYLESLPHFATAVRMYGKFGFETLENPMGESGHTSCNIWMLRPI
ncbi:GNAT family N-acetyltransferase [Aestuariibaculum suncheonense]|uniref:GNAT family N-acetyltransferase n=1 Tax=Aestuariibaculum suncheonense TaxID=1028745 RepID=A0A8J6QG62_9FLAO|nr:GNAT family N-acetyltransferase [Aestuariibaculum suncheonense]MBD0835482.1 GNAT family N-acetyltransferase [Aestuariibaculum suncheonense]